MGRLRTPRLVPLILGFLPVCSLRTRAAVAAVFVQRQHLYEFPPEIVHHQMVCGDD